MSEIIANNSHITHFTRRCVHYQVLNSTDCTLLFLWIEACHDMAVGRCGGRGRYVHGKQNFNNKKAFKFKFNFCDNYSISLKYMVILSKPIFIISKTGILETRHCGVG
jgi:hypothetical protein